MKKLQRLTLEQALIQACENGNLTQVKAIIHRGVQASCQNNYPLQKASLHGHLPIVQYLISQGANVNENNGMAFRWASRNGHQSIISYFLSLPEYESYYDNKIALYQDCLKHNYIDLFKFFFMYEQQHKKNKSFKNNNDAFKNINNYTYLELITQYQHEELLHWVCKNGINIRPHLHKLMLLSCSKNYIKIICHLINNYSEQFDFFKKDYFIQAIYSRQYDIIDFFLENDFNLKKYITPILEACSERHEFELMKFFIEETNFFYKNGKKKKNTPLLKHAVKNNSIEQLTYLLETGFNLSSYSYIALFTALNESETNDYHDDYQDILSFILEQYTLKDWEKLIHFKKEILQSITNKTTTPLREWCFNYIEKKYIYYYLQDNVVNDKEDKPKTKI